MYEQETRLGEYGRLDESLYTVGGGHTSYNIRSRYLATGKRGIDHPDTEKNIPARAPTGLAPQRGAVPQHPVPPPKSIMAYLKRRIYMLLLWMLSKTRPMCLSSSGSRSRRRQVLRDTRWRPHRRFACAIYIGRDRGDPATARSELIAPPSRKRTARRLANGVAKPPIES